MKQQGECRQGKDLLLLEQMEAFLLPKPKPCRSHGRSSYPEHKRSTCSIGFGEENSSATDRKAKGEKVRAICPLTVSNSAGIWRRNGARKPSRDPLLSDAWLYKRKCHDNTEINNFTTIKHPQSSA